MKANRKFVEEDEAVSAVIGVILMVAITVAIAATLYIYVTGVPMAPKSRVENASIAGEGTNDQIKLVLASAGKTYDNGYNIQDHVKVYVNGSKATLHSSTWETGGQLLIGLNGATWEEGPYYCQCIWHNNCHRWYRCCCGPSGEHRGTNQDPKCR